MIIQECKKEIVQLQKQSNEANLVFKEIQRTEKENCVDVLDSFFKEQMLITEEIKVSKAFRLGKGKKAPILCTLKDSSSKELIFQKVKNLKDTDYSIDNQLPPKIKEQKIQRKQLIAENKMKTVDKLILSFEEGKMKVNDKVYEGQHKIPQLGEVLKPNLEQSKARMGIKVVKGGDVTVQGSTFTDFSANVTNLQEVNAAYAKVHQWNGDARHIMCTFRIPHEDHHIYQNYNDDNEHAGGRILLKTNIHRS